jgi:4-amino-4-deoxy-L-arabinose transferase-like glycosyltransferase
MAEQPKILVKRAWPWVIILIALHMALGFSALRKDSAVADEPFHLARAAGLVLLRDSTFAVSHPPLINFISGLPLLALKDLKLPDRSLVAASRAMDPSDRRNALAHLLLEKLNPDAKKIVEAARIPTVLLSALFGLLIFFWAKKIYGPPAGLFALFLYSLDPNILANAHLVTNDLGAALFICLALYFSWRLWEAPKAWNLILAALFLGLAELSKFSAILLYPLYVVIWFIALWLLKKEKPGLGWFSIKPPALYSGLWSLVLVLAGSMIAIWAGYIFSIGPDWNFGSLLHGEICRLSQLTAEIKCGAIGLLALIPIPPRTFYYGLARTLVLTEQHENALYFMGKTSEQGWWYYYPVLFLVKTPLPLLILIGLRASRREKIRDSDLIARLILLAPVFWFFAFFILLNRKEIGIRHLLMVYPLLFIFVSGLATDAALSKSAWRLWLGALLGWFALSSLAAWPNYLTYFNEAAGRTRGGLKISIVGEDWGQDVASLAGLQKKLGLRPLFYQPYVLVSPRSYGLEFEPLNCDQKNAGYYAVHLNQLKRPVKNPELMKCVEWLKPYPPDYKVNDTIWVWKMPRPNEAPGP